MYETETYHQRSVVRGIGSVHGGVRRTGRHFGIDTGTAERVGVRSRSATEVPTLTMLTFTEWYKDGWKALENYINENSDELGFKLDIQQIAGGSEGKRSSRRALPREICPILSKAMVQSGSIRR